MTTDTINGHIESTPGICSGKPRITGRRITVQNIAIWHQRMGRSVDEIATEYNLSLAEVHSALAYYFDHREEIERGINEGDDFIDDLRQSTPSVLEKRMKELRRG